MPGKSCRGKRITLLSLFLSSNQILFSNHSIFVAQYQSFVGTNTILPAMQAEKSPKKEPPAAIGKVSIVAGGSRLAAAFEQQHCQVVDVGAGGAGEN